MIRLARDNVPLVEDVDPRMVGRISALVVGNVLSDSPIHRGGRELRDILPTSECYLARAQIYSSDLFQMAGYEQCPGAYGPFPPGLLDKRGIGCFLQEEICRGSPPVYSSTPRL
jgi:hypothetical protein